MDLEKAREVYRQKRHEAINASEHVRGLSLALRQAELHAEAADSEARKAESILLEIAASQN